MNQKDRYLDEVASHLLATSEERERFVRDLDAHFGEGEARGETPARIIERLGAPETVAAAFNAERELEYAGFWIRLAAYLGDMCLFLIVAIPVIGIALVTSRGVIPEAVGIGVAIPLVLALVGFVLLYFPLLEARFGWTLGKRLMRIRVLHERGGTVSIGQAFVRRLSLYFDMLMPDALFIPFTDKKQRALDILAKTIVVREPGEPAGAGAWIACLCGWLVILGLIASICLPLAR